MFFLPPFFEQEADEDAGGTVVHVTELTLSMQATSRNEPEQDLDAFVPQAVERLVLDGRWGWCGVNDSSLSFRLSSEHHSALRWLALASVCLKDPITADHLPLSGTRLRGFVLEKVSVAGTRSIITRDALSSLLSVEQLVLKPLHASDLVDAIDNAMMREDDEGRVRRKRVAPLRFLRYLAVTNVFGNIPGPVQAARTLGNALRHMLRLDVLDLAGNSLGPEAMEGLVNSLLAPADNTSDDPYKLPPPPLTLLRELNLDNNRLNNGQGGRALGRLLQHTPRLEVLNLGNSFDSEGLKGIFDALSTTEAAADYTHTNHDLSELPAPPTRLTQLRKLYLSGGRFITNEAGRALGHVLQHMPQLEVLDLADNSLGPEAIKGLVNALLDPAENDDPYKLPPPPFPLLRELNLKINDLSTVQAGVALGRLIQRTPRLEVLTLSRNRLGSEVLKGLFNALPMTETAAHRSNTNGGHSELPTPQPPPLLQLRKLYLWCDSVSTNEAGRALGHVLQHMPQLEVLDLGGNLIDAAALEGLVETLRQHENPRTLAQLRVLHLGPRNRISAMACLPLIHLLQHTLRLEVLDVQACDVDDTGLRALLEGCFGTDVPLSPPRPQSLLQHLRVLDLRNNSITDRGARHLLPVLQQQKEEEKDVATEEDVGGVGGLGCDLSGIATTTPENTASTTATLITRRYRFLPRLEQVDLSGNRRCLSTTHDISKLVELRHRHDSSSISNAVAVHKRE